MLPPAPPSTELVDRAIVAMKLDEAAATIARLAVLENIHLMQVEVERDATTRSPRQTKSDLEALAQAATTLADPSPQTTHLLDRLCQIHGLNMSRNQLLKLAESLVRSAHYVVLPPGAGTVAEISPRAKGYAVLAAGNVVRACRGDLSEVGDDELVSKFGVTKFAALAEVLLEGITQVRADRVGQLEWQIRQFRNDELNLNQGLDVTFS